MQPTVANSPIFHYKDKNKQQKARVDFCIRFRLYLTEGVHFQEVQATFFADLTDDVHFQEAQATFFADLTDGF